MNMKIKVAGRIIEIHLMYDKTYSFFEEYAVPKNQTSPDFLIETRFEDLIKENLLTKQGSKLLNRNGKEQVSFFNLEKHEFFAIYHKIAEIIPSFNTFLMHGAVVATDNNAYMFTAPSGTGKSTRAKLWLDEYPGSFIINGDKPFIIVNEHEVLACGTPWCGKEGWNTNTMLPLRACFLLERVGPGEETSIREVTFCEAFPVLIQHTYHPSDPEMMRKTLYLLKALEGRVKFYLFRSALTSEAIQLAYETARPR